MSLARSVRFVAALAALMLLSAACSSGDEVETGAAASDTASANTASTAAPTTAPPTTAPASTAAPSPAPPTTDATAPPEACSTEPGTTSFTFESGGIRHPVRVFVPSSADGSDLPLVLNWHGLGSNGEQQAQLSNYEALAETEGFLVAHPTGVPAPGQDQNSWELAQFDDPTRDDVEMARGLIDRLVTDFCADPNRVYSTGMSNGGFFTARLVCELSDRIAAAVSVAGVSHFDGCSPARAVPFLAYHGTADDVVPFDGGPSSLEGDDALPVTVEFFDQVMPDEFAEFAASASCSLDPTVETVSDEVIRYDYTGCAGDVPMAFFEIADGGHTWPGSPLGPFLVDFLGLTTDDVDATADGWAFMSQFSLE